MFTVRHLESAVMAKLSLLEVIQINNKYLSLSF